MFVTDGQEATKCRKKMNNSKLYLSHFHGATVRLKASSAKLSTVTPENSPEMHEYLCMKCGQTNKKPK